LKNSFSKVGAFSTD
jgi:hypothetical protein